MHEALYRVATCDHCGQPLADRPCVTIDVDNAVLCSVDCCDDRRDARGIDVYARIHGLVGDWQTDAWLEENGQ